MENNRLVDLFLDLVKIDSPSGEEEIFANYLVNYLKENNLVDLIEKDSYGNIYGRISGQGEPIFLAAHMDTVEPGRGIKPKVKDGFITSDGMTVLGVDNKIAIAGILETLHQLKDSSFPHSPIEIIFTRCEESDASGGVNFDYSKLTAKKGYTFDYCSPLGTIIVSSPLNERCDIKLMGKTSHSTQPENGIHILDFLKEFLHQVKTGRYNNISFNIGQIEVGHVRNSIPAEGDIKAEIRSFTEEDLEDQKNLLKTMLKNISENYKIDFTIEFLREYPSYTHVSKESRLFLEETSAKMSKCGIKPNIIKDWAISDANTFNNNGLLCLNLSDGGENPHSKEERVRISSLTDLAKLIIGLVTP